MKIDSEAALALLRCSDPVQLDDLVSADDLQHARDEIEVLIAAAPAAPVAHASTTQRRRTVRRSTDLPGRGPAWRVVVPGGAALVVAACVLLALPSSRSHGGGLLSEAAAFAARSLQRSHRTGSTTTSTSTTGSHMQPLGGPAWMRSGGWQTTARDASSTAPSLVALVSQPPPAARSPTARHSEPADMTRSPTQVGARRSATTSRLLLSSAPWCPRNELRSGNAAD